jgi:hypothetical protein
LIPAGVLRHTNRARCLSDLRSCEGRLVILAGFALVALPGIVTSWSESAQRNVRVLLPIGALTVFFSIFPLILQSSVQGPG